MGSRKLQFKLCTKAGIFAFNFGLDFLLLLQGWQLVIMFLPIGHFKLIFHRAGV